MTDFEAPASNVPLFAPLQNDRLLRAARGLHVDKTPVWMMRQAGRYLPEYRKIRETHSFFECCRTAPLAAEITIQPVERFDIDAAIIFSDILVIPEALGVEVNMVPGTGPVLPEPIASPADLKRLEPDGAADRLQYVYDALTETRNRLDGRVPLIGFSGAPWTLMAYLIEGGGSKSFSKPRSWLYQEPEASHRLLAILTEAVVEYLSRQILAGAQYVQIFDSWAGLLGPRLFQRFALGSLRTIACELKARHPDTPVAVFARGAHHAIESLAEADYDVISIDWTLEPSHARRRAGSSTTLQGNLDPAALFAGPDQIEDEVRRILTGFGKHRTIANLGHGMMPSHDPEHARAFVDAVHRVSESM